MVWAQHDEQNSMLIRRLTPMNETFRLFIFRLIFEPILFFFCILSAMFWIDLWLTLAKIFLDVLRPLAIWLLMASFRIY